MNTQVHRHVVYTVMSFRTISVSGFIISCGFNSQSSATFAFRPLLKLFNSLLVVGLIEDDDLREVLKLLHPAAFDEDYEPGT